MKCLQCGADLLDSATFCQRCGTPTRAASFSYLPAGVPPWPITVPQSTPYAPTTVIEAPQSGGASTTAVVPKPRRSIGNILVNISLLVLSIVIGVGATLGILAANGQFASAPATAPGAVHLPAATPTTTAGTPGATPTTTAQGNQLPTPSSFQSVTVAAVGISLKYPSDWVQDQPQTDANGTAIDFHPQQQLGIIIVFHRFSSGTSATIKSTNQINQNNIQSLQGLQGLHNLQPTPVTTPQRTIGGVQWDEKDASFTNDNGLLFHFTTIAVQHNKIYYDISFYTPDMFYNEAMQKYIQPMLDSLKFNS